MNLINTSAFFKQTIAAKVIELLHAEFGVQGADASQFKFEIPPDDKMGHLAFACFPLAKVAKKAPPLIAKQLAESWGESPFFQAVVAAGPYLNFHFSPRYLAEELIPACISSDRYGNTDLGTGKTLLLEYSSPNTNKPLHLGHGRNNLLGAVLSRILKCNGYELIKANLVNDRGIHICKSMLAYQKWGSGETPESTGIKGDKLVGKYYVLYDQKEKANPEILQEVQEMLRMWEAGDPETIDLWKQLNGWVLDGFRETYDRMTVPLTSTILRVKHTKEVVNWSYLLWKRGSVSKSQTGPWPSIWKQISWGKKSFSEGTARRCISPRILIRQSLNLQILIWMAACSSWAVNRTTISGYCSTY